MTNPNGFSNGFALHPNPFAREEILASAVPLY
jgi:hypothetical protein